MKPRIFPIALAVAALLGGLGATAAHAGEGDPAHSHEPERYLCLSGKKTILVTPDEEDTIGEPYTVGACPTPGTTTSPEIVTLCIQGVTTTGPKGSANPNGYLYHEGPCEEPAPPAPARRAPAVKAQPRFTG